jgi:hypothetical protein
VKKTNIYLPPEMDEALARMAVDEGLTKAELIRRGLDQMLNKPKRPKLSVGVYESPDGRSIAENVEEYLAETGFGED